MDLVEVKHIKKSVVMTPKNMSVAFMNRVPLYLHYLESLKTSDVTNISATKISKALGLGEVLVRKELGVISGNGKPKLGYTVKGLINDIWRFLQANNHMTNTIIVGAGSLGSALMGHADFKRFGINIVAAFDIDKKKINNKTIYPMSALSKFVKKNDVKIGIIAVDAHSAVTVYNELIRAGIRGIWNFTEVIFEKNDDVVVKNENLALAGAYLNILLLETLDNEAKENIENNESKEKVVCE